MLALRNADTARDIRGLIDSSGADATEGSRIATGAGGAMRGV